jgi:hypothetical protein
LRPENKLSAAPTPNSATALNAGKSWRAADRTFDR